MDSMAVLARDSMAVLARHSARFDVLQIQFDAVTGKHLAVAGLRVVQVSIMYHTCTMQH